MGCPSGLFGVAVAPKLAGVVPGARGFVGIAFTGAIGTCGVTVSDEAVANGLINRDARLAVFDIVFNL